MNTSGAATQKSPLTLEEKYSVFFLVRDSRNLPTETPVFTFFSTTGFPCTQETPSCLWQNTLATAITFISTGSKQSPQQLHNLFYEVLMKKSNR